MDVNLVEETLALRRVLAASPEWDFLARYDLLGKRPPVTLQERAVRLIRTLLAKARILPPYITKYVWLPTLKHAPRAENGCVLLIWALGAKRDELQHACEGFAVHLKDMSSLVPVLVTDVADFAYFSRLGWLVEYLPGLIGEGQSYQVRKQCYLAWRYRNALVVHASAGLTSEGEWKILMEAGCS